MGVKKIPSYLKALAERYARTQADIESLKVTTQITQERAEYYKKLSVSSAASLESAILLLQSLDVLIRDYNESLDPSKINPVNAWKDRDGKKGALEKETFELVRLYGEEGVTSRMLQGIFAKRLGLPLEGELAEKHKANRFRCTLKRLQRKGLNHCYSRGPEQDEVIPPDELVPDGSKHKPRNRIFCPIRYEQSLFLVARIDALITDNGLVSKSRYLNFFSTTAVTQGQRY